MSSTGRPAPEGGSAGRGGPWLPWERVLLAVLLLSTAALYLSTLPTLAGDDGYAYILDFDRAQPYTEFLRVTDIMPEATNYRELGIFHPHHILTNAPGYVFYRLWVACGWQGSSQVPWFIANVLWSLAMLAAVYTLLRRIVSRGVAFTTIGLLAASTGLWSIATSGEVYASGAAGAAVVLLAAHRVWSTPAPSTRALVGLGLLHAVAALIHIANGVLAFPILVVFLSRAPPGDRLRHLFAYAAPLGVVAWSVVAAVGVWGAGADSVGEVIGYALMYPMLSETFSGMGWAQLPRAYWMFTLNCVDVLASPAGWSQFVFWTAWAATVVAAVRSSLAVLVGRERTVPRALVAGLHDTASTPGFVLFAAAALALNIGYFAVTSPYSRDYPVLLLPLFSILAAAGIEAMSHRVSLSARARNAVAVAWIAGLLLHSWHHEISLRDMTPEEVRSHILVSRVPETTERDVIYLSERINQREKWWIHHQLRPAARVDILTPYIFDTVREQIETVTGRGGAVHFVLSVDPLESVLGEEHSDGTRMSTYREFLAEVGAEPGLRVRELYRGEYVPNPEINVWYSYRLADTIKLSVYEVTAAETPPPDPDR